MNQRLCPKCSSQMDDDSVFCSECGYRTEQVPIQTQDRQDSSVTQKSKGKAPIFKIVVVLLVLAVVGFGFFKLQGSFNLFGESGSLATAKTGRSPIDFSKQVLTQDGISINSSNISVFNSIKQTPADKADLSGAWTGKAYYLGGMIEYDKTKVGESYSIPKPEDIKTEVSSSCALSIDFKSSEVSDKVMLKLTFDKELRKVI